MQLFSVRLLRMLLIAVRMALMITLHLFNFESVMFFPFFFMIVAMAPMATVSNV